MNKDTFEGRMKRARGKVMVTTGRITGNKTLESDGKIEIAFGDVQESIGKLKAELNK